MAAKIDFSPEALGFDIEAVRAKYVQERDKRLRPDGQAQYVEMKGGLSHYADDPYAPPPAPREPKTDDVEILIIGGGFGGQLAGARLREAGFQDIRFVEKGGEFGGTWYWNRYPGAACDIESYSYLPLLEETGYIPTERYAKSQEIRDHAARIARHYDLNRDALFQTEVTELRWMEEQSNWLVKTNRGDAFRARFVVVAVGPAHVSKLPGIPGMEAFKGHSFHTSRWDYDYTGGDALGGQTRLGDKRVAVIGTGATAIQCVPFLGEYSKQLYVFQRTPSSVEPRLNDPTDPAWAASLGEGWQRQRVENLTRLILGMGDEIDLVQDGWTELNKTVVMLAAGEAKDLTPQERWQLLEIADYKKMHAIREEIDAIVKSPDAAEALKPWYRHGCKRPTFSDTYLQTFNRPNVRLVDTGGRGVDRITEKGVVFDGVEYEVDCIVYATGFEIGGPAYRRISFDVTGCDGVKLADYWADGMKSLHGFYAHGFPNCFHMGIGHNGITANVAHMLNEQAIHIAHILTALAERQAKRIEPQLQAQEDWGKAIHDKPSAMLEFLSFCTPGYFNNEGQPGKGAGVLGELYPDGPLVFHAMLEDWRKAGVLEGLDIA